MTLPPNVKKITNPKPLLSTNAWAWLSYKPSLTARLREFTNQQISFHLIKESWELVENIPTWVRCIQWRLADNCWIEANLLIPKSSIVAETASLLSSHERPIGEQLFTEPSLTRSNFEFFEVPDQPATWIRKSTFTFKNQPLTLIETFYPCFFEAIEP